MFPPPELWPLMEQQGSLLFRAQLLAAGVTPSTIDKRLGRGQLVAVQSGVYRLPGAALEPRQLIRAATERANGYATGWSALGLYGVLDLDARLAPWVAVPRDRQVHGVGFIVQRQRLDDRDRRRVGGIPCVGPFLALCDYARRVQGLRLLDAIDESRRAGLISLERLRDRAVQLGKHRGAVEVRRLFTQGLLDQDGEGERRLARALASVELYPVWGVEIVRGVIVDACLPTSSLIPEFDGMKWHLPGRRSLDGARRGTLEADGWAFEPVTWDDVVHRPERTAARIRARHAARIAAHPAGVPSGLAATFVVAYRTPCPVNDHKSRRQALARSPRRPRP